MSATRPDSPCIALCSTALGDNVCRGCARTFAEVSQWCFMSADEREAVWLRLPARQRLLQLAAAYGALLELDEIDGQEWGRLPDGSLYRLDEAGWLRWRDAASARENACDCAGLSLDAAAAWLRGQ
ncbi:Predicted Fe-S protein [Chromobacterium violaceum]|uniref:Predicted Fe-S protein n=1 Tax=Chromobacterium violaceum TaxID=536 RepID=A0A3S4I589_CHRVL|nr:Predicted Fe-S protein [Chromobacterium violaceum]